MALSTRLTERFGITHPIVLGPMAFASGGRLAAAVSAAGGLGMIGGGYGDAGWLEAEFAAAGDAAVGCGLITWSLARHPELLDLVLENSPRAMMLSFGDPTPFGERINAAGVAFVCQVQTLEMAREALGAGADIIVAQGGEAGGHGAERATVTLVPEIADLCAARSPQSLVLAAGGIADGRGVAAALMLGADGALMGSRFWASQEALVHPNLQHAVIAADGDSTLRNRTADIVRRIDWPEMFTARVLRNRFVERWHGRDAELAAAAAQEGPRYLAALEAGDAECVCVLTGEAAGLIRDVPPAGEIVRRVVAEAERLLVRNARNYTKQN